jgi:Common central domain of tyrosinase/Polyphenol oxidase middle domain
MAIANSSERSRREVLTGAASMAGAAALGAATAVALRSATAQGAPLVRRDVATIPTGDPQLAKFAGAIQEMMDRSATNPNDPKGWLVNANAHRDFCAIPSTNSKQIHFCYWFLSWHRAYIAVTERKVREIAGDQTLTYPYWNWSSDRRIPAAYASGPLAKAQRLTPPRPVDDGEVDYNPNDPVLKKLGVSALGARFFVAKTPSDIRRSFGGIARPNSSNMYGNNRLEGTPHGPIHNYVGGDMSDFATAGRDPIFFAHHGNLDRLWEIWRKDAAHKATEPPDSDTDFRNHSFPFTWLDGTTIQVKVADTLDTTKLGYAYDNLDVFRPNAPVVIVAQDADQRLPAIATQKLRVPLSPQAAGPDERKVLEITNVEKPDRIMTVGVYLKPANAPATEPGTNVGSFAAVKAGDEIAWPSTTLAFDITAAAEKYAGQELTVELVPYRLGAQSGGPPVNYPPLKYGEMRIVTEQ